MEVLRLNYSIRVNKELSWIIIIYIRITDTTLFYPMSIMHLFGKIVDVTQNFNAPLNVLAAVLFPGGLLWLFIDRGKRLIVERTKSI